MSDQTPEEIQLAQELRELGRQLKEAVRVAREHPQTREFERQVSQAVNDLGSEIDRAIKTAREDERVKNAQAQLRQTAQTFKEGKAQQQVEHGLAQGVRALNEQLRHAIQKAEATPPAPEPEKKEPT